MKFVWGTALIILTACLQVSLFGHMRPLGIMPNLMVIAVVALSLWGTASFCLAAAIGGGILLDIASGSDFGLRTAFFVVVSLGIIAGRQLGLQADSWISVLMLVVVATILYDAAVIATLRTAITPDILGRVGANVAVTGFIAMAVHGIKLLIQARRPTPRNLNRDAWQ
jgi:rod shape-determining protein MreD